MTQNPDFGGLPKKVYVQLQPDAAGVGYLRQIQAALPPQPTGRPLPAAELHMTVIHFGKIADVYDRINAERSVDYSKYAAALEAYITLSEVLDDGSEYILEPIGFDRFGANNGTLVITYQSTPALDELHVKAYELLRQFFAAVGMTDPDAFMAADPNFQFAGTLRPHITLYKGFRGDTPEVELPALRLRMMPVTYQ